MRRRAIDKLAAVDLGSNSFHLFVARVSDGHLHILDRLKDHVALAAGLDARGNLSSKAQARALTCLRRFGQRLRGMPKLCVRAVGTNTFRRARNAKLFLKRAEKALGHEIEIISGREEARLIYLGVANSLSRDRGRRLIIDIGGGSTECIIGRRFEPILADSLYVGCVSHTLEYFPGGRIKEQGFQKAYIAARLEFDTLARRYRRLGWNECIGSSGTILAAEQILRLNGWSRDGITRSGLERLHRGIIQAGHIELLPSFRGISEDRAPVFPGGLAILEAAFDEFDIERMHTSAGALREGLAYDLLGRFGDGDVRDTTIRRFSEEYHVDLAQASRIERTALLLLRQSAGDLKTDAQTGSRFLSWASHLLEIGLSISYQGYHKHSAYIVAHADMPGFSREEQAFLAALIRAHRRKLSTAYFSELSPGRARDALRLCLLLRIAVSLHRGRAPRAVPPVKIHVHRGRIELAFPKGWLKRHPLTHTDLEDESTRLQPLGFALAAR